MPLTDNRLLPLASIELFDTGQGDPVVTDHGNAFYDVIRETWQFGTFSQDVAGNTPLELLPEVGLICRPSIVLQDNRLADYVTGSGDWEERLPRVGASPTYRLVQLDNTPGIEWQARSVSVLPRNPSVVFSFDVADNPPDLDADLYPPFYQVEFGEIDGQPQWALRFSRDQGNQLLRWLGLWVPVKDIGSPPAEIAGEGEEFLVLLQCLRGGIYVSLDFGFTYAEFRFVSQEVAGGSALPDSGLSALGFIPVVVNASSFTFRGSGGQAILGVHQVAMEQGAYRSADRNTFTSRSILATATATPVGYAPEGTSIDCVDDGDPVAGDAAYLATLTPTVAGVVNGWSAYWTPELYAVKLTYPVVASVPAGTYTAPFDQTTGGPQTSGAGIVSVDVSKPYELDGAKASVNLRRDPSVNFTWPNARWAKLRILLGHCSPSGVETWWTVFTGYCRKPRAGSRVFNEADLVLELENASIRFRRARWTEFDSIPLGGFTPNQALDYILYTEGLGASYRAWDPVGDAFALPTGLPENPFEWPRRGEAKWDTMRRIAGYAGLELGVLDNGAFATVVKQWVNTSVNHVLQAVPASSLPAMIQEVGFGLDASESATAVLVRAVDAASGMPVWAWAADVAAETNPASSRFSPWREWVFDEVQGAVTPAFLALRTQTLAYEHFAMKWEADTTAEVDLSWARRDMAQVQGANVGIVNSDTFVVLSLRHRYEADPSFASLQTTAGMRRL